MLVGDELHGVRADDVRRLWHSYNEQPAAEERHQDERSGSRMSAGRARLVRKDACLEAQPAGKHRPEPKRADRAEWSKEQGATEIARGIRRRLDDREHVAARRAVVHPLYVEQQRRSADQPAANRLPADRALGQSWSRRPPPDKLAWHGTAGSGGTGSAADAVFRPPILTADVGQSSPARQFSAQCKAVSLAALD